MARFEIVCVVWAVGLWACGPARPRGNGKPAPERHCPGQEGCDGPSASELKAGFAAVSISPAGYERVRPELLERTTGCSEGSPRAGDGLMRCGALRAEAYGQKYFDDCGLDGKCPGDAQYAGPDADGTEGDGKAQVLWLAGFGNGRPLMGKHDEVWARAVAVEQGDVRIAWVVLDTIGLFRDDVQRIRARVQRLAPDVAIDYLSIGATHNHEAPDSEGLWGPEPGGVPQRGIDKNWFSQTLVEKSAQAVVDAVRALKPVKLTAVQPRLGALTAMLINDSRAPYVSDDAVTALKFDDLRTGQTVGTLVSWGNHPETLADTNNLLTSDYPGALRDAVEARFGGTAVFLNGALGGMMTSLGADVPAMDGSRTEQRSFAKAKAVGERVAKVAIEALENAAPLSSAELAFGAQTLSVPVENEKMHLAWSLGLIARAAAYDASRPPTGDNIPKIDTEIAKVQLGPVRFLLVPGELFPELAVGYDAKWAFGRPQIAADNPAPPNLAAAPLGPYLKDQLGGEMPCVLGMMNDHLGYLVPPYDYKLDGKRPYYDEALGDHYEETNSIGPAVVPALLNAYRPLLEWEPL